MSCPRWCDQHADTPDRLAVHRGVEESAGGLTVHIIRIDDRAVGQVDEERVHVAGVEVSPGEARAFAELVWRAADRVESRAGRPMTSCPWAQAQIVIDLLRAAVTPPGAEREAGS